MHWTLDYVRALDSQEWEDVLNVLDGLDTGQAHERKRQAERKR